MNTDKHTHTYIDWFLHFFVYFTTEHTTWKDWKKL